MGNPGSNAMVHVSMTGGGTLQTTAGEIARQAAFIVEPGFAGATLQIANLSLSSFAPMRVAANGKMVQQANGRAFLIDCPGIPARKDYARRDRAHIHISGLVVSNIPQTHFIASTEGTNASVQVRGFTHNGVASNDGPLQ